MKKFFQLSALFFILIFVFLSLFMYFYRQPIFDYLNAANNLKNQDASGSQIVMEDESLSPGDTLNLDILNNPKFQAMEKTQVDLSGLVIPSGSTASSTSEGQPEPEPEFEVGNSNPFRAF